MYMFHFHWLFFDDGVEAVSGIIDLPSLFNYCMVLCTSGFL